MAVNVEVDTLQGILDGSIWFHLDLASDVLYLRHQATRAQRVFGEETAEGYTLLRTDSGDVAGMTVVNYWHRFGAGRLEEASIEAIKRQVAASAASLVA